MSDGSAEGRVEDFRPLAGRDRNRGGRRFVANVPVGITCEHEVHIGGMESLRSEIVVHASYINALHIFTDEKKGKQAYSGRLT